MKFKILNEEYTSDDLYQELIDYIYNELEYTVDNLAMKAASDIDDYDADYCSEEPNMSSQNAYNKLRQAAEYFAEFLLKNAPEVIHEDLKEDIDDVVEIEVPVLDISTEEIEATDLEPKGPEVGEDTGIADLLLSLINSENDTIKEYNTFKANLTSHPEFAAVINDITNEENNHVGMLQTLLKKISPNAETIKEGEIEAEEILKNDLSEDEMETNMEDVIDDKFYSRYI